MKKYDAVIFDLDGTLLNTLKDLATAVNVILSKYNEKERTIEQIRLAVGNGNRNLMIRSLEQGESHPQFENIFKEYVEYYKAHDTVYSVPYAGIIDILSYCRENNIKTAIISNKLQAATSHLATHYFQDLVDISLGDDMVRPKKPEPDSAFIVFEKLNTNADRCLYVGDSLVDYEFSKNVGMDCALVSYGFVRKEVLKEAPAEYLLDTPQELFKLIQTYTK